MFFFGQKHLLTSCKKEMRICTGKLFGQTKVQIYGIDFSLKQGNSFLFTLFGLMWFMQGNNTRGSTLVELFSRAEIASLLEKNFLH